MPSLRFTSILAVAAILYVLPLAAQTPPVEGTAIIGGRVMLKGEPARGILIALQSGGGNPVNAIRAVTDEAGRFRFERLRAGRYGVVPLVPGYVAPGSSQYGVQGRAVIVSDGEKVENLELALVFGGVITGRITDARGESVTGEHVSLTRFNEQGKPQSFFLTSNGGMQGTDDRGIYRIYGLPAGRYLVSVGFAQRPNSITMTSARVFYPKTYHPNAQSETEAVVVEIAEGQEKTGIDIAVIAMKKNYDVSGRVVYADTSRPAIGVEIKYGTLQGNGRKMGPTASGNDRTNSLGEFRVQNILPGRYAAFASVDQKDNAYSDPVPFEISDGDVSGVEIRLRRGSSMSGGVALEGVNDPALSARFTEVMLSVSVTTEDLAEPFSGSSVKPAADGSFSVAGLRPGRAGINVIATAATRQLSLLRIERNGVPHPEGIDVGAGEQVSGVRVVLGYGSGAIRGTLRITGGAVPDGIRLFIKARRIDSGVILGGYTVADSQGAFRMENLPAGEYELFLSPFYSSGEPPSGSEEFVKMLAEIKSRVVVNNDAESRANLVLDLGRREGGR